MVLSKRYCAEYVVHGGTVECFQGGFWYSQTGIIVKWAILSGIFLFIVGWFVGGYVHAKQRMKKGKPLLAYHRFLVSYQERKKYGQTPQNHFTFYATQNPYAPPPPGHEAYGPRPDGTWPEPPPMYSNETPPGYGLPPGGTKMNPNQQDGAVEMQQYGAPPMQQQQQYGTPPPPPMGAQQTGTVGGQGDVEGQNQQLPPRPQQAKLAISSLMSRLRK